MNEYKINSYEDIKGRLCMQLVNIKGNENLLDNAACMPVGCGLALVALLKIPEEIAKDAIAIVPRDLIENMPDTDIETVMKDAVDASAMNDKPKLCDIRDMLLSPILGAEPENYLNGGEAPTDALLVLTTEGGKLGACALMYPGIKEKIAEIIGGDYFLLPSSIHEIMVIPDNGEHSPEDLAKMVKEINNSEVAPEDRLCNRVFRYCEKDGEMIVAADPDRKKELAR